jgi:hypothetical protein
MQIPFKPILLGVFKVPWLRGPSMTDFQGCQWMTPLKVLQLSCSLKIIGLPGELVKTPLEVFRYLIA